MNGKRWMIVLAISLTIALGYGGCTLWRRRDALAQESDYETTTVRRGTLTMTVEGSGTLAPRADVELAFRMGGPVAEVLVREGESVGTEQPLVRLETAQLESKVSQAKARLDSAEAQLAQVLAGPQAEDVAELEASLRSAQSQLNAAAAQRDQTMAEPGEAEIADAHAQVASAEAEHRKALIAYDSVDDSDENQKEQAQYDLWASEVALEAARTQLEETKAGAEPEEIDAAQAEVAKALKQRDAAQAQLELLLAGPTDEQVESARAAVDQARVGLERAKLQQAWATLTSPKTGTVVALDASPGEIASAGETVVVLNDLSSLEVIINVDETDVTRLRLGQKAAVRLDAFPEKKLTGEVTYIAPRARLQSGVVFFPVTVGVHGNTSSTGAGTVVQSGPSAQDLSVKAGMTVDVDIVASTREDVLVVPLRAVHSEGDRTYVERLADGRVQRVDVTLGLTTDTEAEIVAGLQDGDVVTVVPAAEQEDGLRPPGLFGGGS